MTHMNDDLISAIITTSQVESGLPVKAVSTLGHGRAAILARPARPARPNLEWSADEDAFLTRNHGYLSESEIAAALGRTVTAVHIRWKRELRLTAPSKNPETLTAEHIAMGLGVDGKSVHKLMDRGLLPGRRLPHGSVTRVMERRALLAWIVNPEHWCYFDPARVGDKRPRGQRGFTGVYDNAFWAHARRLITLRRARWDDEWLTPRQAGRMLGGVHNHIVNREILAGRLPATRWGNWRIKRSALLSASLNLYKGAWTEGRLFTTAAERFMLLASAVGLVPQEIAPLMGMKAKYIEYRIRTLRRSRRLKAMAKEIHIGHRPGVVFVDWRAYAAQFPRLARIMRAFAAGESLPRSELGIVRGVLHAYVAWHASSKPQHALEKRLRKFGGRHTAEFYHHLVNQIMAAGLGDPLRETKQGGRK